ncbi:MAG TPA: sugar ABC transporter substrate-binding protein, partial [Acetobacteraceae bacterium]|jgi:ABC-type glycerol-3-phosphate transport system substrate-binding protein|nr:sugar ABC transporter substrate-binding protein [Acetobacteraceae bacterium]
MTGHLGIGRRTLAKAGLATAALGGIGVRRARAQEQVQLTFAVWAAQAEEAAFNAVVSRYEAAHPNVKVKLEINGTGAQLYQNVDTRLAGRQAPDLFRCQYQQIGRYAAARAVVDLGKYVDASAAEGFAPAFWKAVNYKGKPYALPHHTDTFALYVNRDWLQKLGAEMPKSIDKSWTWQEFITLARAMKEKAGAPYGFAMSWQGTAAYRWLPFLYQHGGTLLNEDLSAPTLGNQKGIETIAWTQSWFKDQLVPPSTSIKSAEQPQNLFANGTIGLLLAGDWQIPFLSKNMTKWGWDVTYMPRDVAMASDLGGNCVAVSRDSKHPEVAADFLKFLTDPDNMRDFCVTAQFLPVRKSLMSGDVKYTQRSDAMNVFVEQATTIPAHMVATETMPQFSKINAVLIDQLDLAFTSGQDPAATAKNIDTAVQSVLAA